MDLCELVNAPERQRKAPECPKAFVHDFSLGSTADYAYMLDFNVVTAVIRRPVSLERILGSGVDQSKSSIFLKLSADKLLVFK